MFVLIISCQDNYVATAPNTFCLQAEQKVSIKGWQNFHFIARISSAACFHKPNPNE